MPVGDDTDVYCGHLPHLSKRGKTYFVTFCTRHREEMSAAARDIVLQCCLHGHGVQYWLDCGVVMPDHVHLIVTPFEDVTLQTVMQRIKSSSSHLVNSRLGRTGKLWQRESFDHILRSDEKLSEKIDYVCDNPVRKGLVASADQYRWLWRQWV